MTDVHYSLSFGIAITDMSEPMEGRQMRYQTGWEDEYLADDDRGAWDEGWDRYGNNATDDRVGR